MGLIRLVVDVGVVQNGVVVGIHKCWMVLGEVEVRIGKWFPCQLGMV